MPHHPGSSAGRPPRPPRAKRFTQARPTRHRPGSESKIRLLEQRAALGLPLFHPGDAPARPSGVNETAFGKFRARVTLEGCQEHVGCFASTEEAAAAVRAARQGDAAEQVREADALLAERGWDVEDELGCDCEGGGCMCG